MPPALPAIAPFRAVRYAGPRAPLADLTCPPHDCISPAGVQQRLQAHEHNVVRIVLPAPEPGDARGPGTPSKHARAAALLQGWLAEGVMQRDAAPAFYSYQVTTGPPSDRRVMRGFFARVALDHAARFIHPHERTLDRPTKDRLLLRQAAQADVEPIWFLYRDERGWVEYLLSSIAFDELARFVDEHGDEHRLWRVDRPEAVGEIVAQFEDRHLVNADGHHRYRTAVEHADATGRPEHDSILACLVRDTDPGLRIEATHRLLHSMPFDGEAALAKASPAWTIGAAQPLPPLEDLEGRIPADGCLVVVPAALGDARVHELRPASPWPPQGRLDSLAVTRVHGHLLQACWGIDAEHPERHVRYARGADHAVAEVVAGTAQLAVLLPPEPVQAVLDVARQGGLMPQKATYFVPKLRSGLVVSILDEPRPVPWQDRVAGPGKADFRRPALR